MPTTSLDALPNVGPVLRDHLVAVGIETPAELRRLGAREAFERIRTQRDAGACLQLLYGIAGAVAGIRDTDLAPTTKAELREFFRSLD